MRLIWGTVVKLSEQEGAQRKGYSELFVEVDGRDGQATAIAYPELTGPVAAGDRVLLNTTAVDLDLGTGGKHFVVARAEDACAGSAEEAPATAGSADSTSTAAVHFEEAMQPEAGHLMKLRYTPHQLNVLCVEAQESPYHKVMETRDSLEGVPVVCCGLHSQVPLVAAAIKKAMPSLVVGYVMDDSAALALNLSKILADATEVGLIDVTVSTGQAFGGQIEAINLHSGLLAAVHVGGCDVVIAGIGPGLAGTGTPFGHAGVTQGEIINATATLGGNPVVCLRMSQADKRDRHQGISHHSLTALSRIALAPATIAAPFMDEDCPVRELVDGELDEMPNPVGHMAFQLEESFYDEEALRGLKVTTMGRDFTQDPIFFEAAAAAGATAAMIAVMTIEEEASAAIEDHAAKEAAAAGSGPATVAADRGAAGGCSAQPSTGQGCKEAGNCPSPCDN